jgi:AraC-like DNA-binding protein
MGYIVNQKVSFLGSGFMGDCPGKYLIKLMKGGERVPSDASSQCPTTEYSQKRKNVKFDMTKTQLQGYVRGQFGVDLREFLKQKAEVEHLHDYEIATILGVDNAFIGKLRKRYGIRKANGFRRRFERTHGKGALSTFKEIIENPDHSLADVAKHFGFSRENARQVYKKIYGRPHTRLFRRKLQARKRKALNARMKSKRLGSLMKVTKKMKALGFSPLIRNDGSVFTIIANGHKLGFRCASRPVFVGTRRYFRISQIGGASKRYDFLICLCRNNGKSACYVIPNHAMPKHGVHLLPEARPRESKYAQFKDAWHLLA